MNGIADWARVDECVAKYEKGRCVVGVSVLAPGGLRYEHNGERRFVAASTVKIAILVELYRQVEAGIRKLDDIHVLTDADRAPGSGVMLRLHSGITFTLADLAYLMMSISDNTATNLFIDMFGMEAIGANMQRVGMAQSTIGRKMMGRAAQGSEQENWATPRDYSTLIQALLENRAASLASCAEMVRMLEEQQNDRRIARWLPKVGRPRWGTKTGSVAGVCNDVGFVETTAGPVILAVFVEQPANAHAGEEIIGDISKAALDDVAAS